MNMCAQGGGWRNLLLRKPGMCIYVCENRTKVMY